MFNNKVAVVTGGAGGIGKVICEEFKKAGVHVCVIDKEPNDYFVGDIAEEETLRVFVAKVLRDYGIPQGEWEIPWILPIWCYFCAVKKPDSLPEKIYPLMGV